MKRVFSWLVLLACMVAFYYLEYFFWMLIVYIFYAIYNFSEVLFWVLVVCEGTTALFMIIFGIVYGGQLTVEASQAVSTSKKGARYISLPMLSIAFCALILICIPVGIVHGATFLLVAGLITMLIYSISVLVNGQRAANDTNN